PQSETFFCCLLSVRIIQARNICWGDLVSASDCYVTLWLPSASNKLAKTKTISNSSNSVWNENFHFIIQPLNILELKLYDEDIITKDDHLFTVVYDLAQVRPGETVHESFTLSLVVRRNGRCRWKGHLISLSLYSSLEDLDEFLCKRKKVVADALEKILQLDHDLQADEVPVIAVTATGGSVRAMSSLYGHLLGLQKLNLLNCVTYIAGASGSTWTMRSLYEDTDWSHKDLMGPISKARKHVTKSKSSAFSLESLKHYDKELRQRAQEGHSISVTDVWSLIVDHMFHDELSSQQEAVIQGQNALPIYLAINVKEDTQSTFEFKEWCEFSPYEVGFPKYGAFIRSDDLGSEFFMGRLMKKIPESRICYLEGSLLISFIIILTFWEHSWWGKTSCLICPLEDVSNTVNGILTKRLLENQTSNFLKGIQLHKEYYQQREFVTWNDSQLDLSPNQLTPLEKELCLADAGYYINTSCLPLLRKERKVDLILSFDYNLLETCFQVRLFNLFIYCLEQGIPFPKIVLTEEDKKNPKECYLFADEENPDAPLVLHFPLVNSSFREYKAQGVRRGPVEMAEGKVELTSLSPYKMTNLTYSEGDFDKMLKLSDYNVQNNSNLILQTIHKAMNRRLQPSDRPQGQPHVECITIV
uniref:Phospholipase A2 n=1 Tax=Sphenodon punctatus TaxID=8508 RepID=A0A8D0HU99_SPHPU